MILASIRSKQDQNHDDLRARASPLALLDSMFREQCDEIFHGVYAGHYFRLRQFIISKSSEPSFRLLTPPPSTTVALGIPQASTSIPQFGPRDILVECSDGTRHLVHSYILAFHSPILGKKIKTAHITPTTQVSDSESDSPDNEWRCRPPVIYLTTINPDTLAILLQFCYGTALSPPRAPNLPALAPALLASQKYKMSQVEKLIVARWHNLATLNPLEAYFVAVQHGLETYARAAAMVVLEKPIADSYVDIMESSSALSYLRILEYYRSYTDAVEGHLNRVITEWKAGSPGPQGVRHSETVIRFLEGLVRKVGENGPRSRLDVDAARLFRRFCSRDSNAYGGGILWPDAWLGTCDRIVGGLLDISVLHQTTEDAIHKVSLRALTVRGR